MIDTDGDGISDGPFIPSGYPSITGVKDAYPHNPEASMDTDGDGLPDNIVQTTSPIIGILQTDDTLFYPARLTTQDIDPDADNDGVPNAFEITSSNV